MNRRHFLSAAAPASLLPVLSAADPDVPPIAAPPTSRRHPIGISTYSFWRFKNDDYRPAEKCLELAHELGFDGVELLQMQLPLESKEWWV